MEDDVIKLFEDEQSLDPVTGSAGPKVVEGDETDRAPTDKLCFDFMSKGICANAFCPSRHSCTNLGSWLQEMKSMSERCVRHHHTIVSTLSDMLNGTSPLHRKLLESHCNVNDFHISKLLMAIIRKNREVKQFKLSRNAAHQGCAVDQRAVHYLDDTLYSLVCFIADPRSPFFPECITACVSSIFPTTPKGAHTYLSACLLKKICTRTPETINPELTKTSISALMKLGHTISDKSTLVKMYSLIRRSFDDTGDLWIPEDSNQLGTSP